MALPGTRYLRLAAPVALILVGVSPALAGAQQQAERDSVIAEFSADLAELQRRVGSASAQIREFRLGFGGADVEFEGAMPMLAPDSARVVESGTPMRAAPREDAPVRRTLDEGARARLLGISGEWYEVLTASREDGETSGWIRASAARLEYPDMYAAGMVGTAGIWESVIDKARDLRDKYVNNEYVRVTGFDVQLGITGLSLTVGFEFK